MLPKSSCPSTKQPRESGCDSDWPTSVPQLGLLHTSAFFPPAPSQETRSPILHPTCPYLQKVHAHRPLSFMISSPSDFSGAPSPLPSSSPCGNSLTPSRSTHFRLGLAIDFAEVPVAPVSGFELGAIPPSGPSTIHHTVRPLLHHLDAASNSSQAPGLQPPSPSTPAFFPSLSSPRPMHSPHPIITPGLETTAHHHPIVSPQLSTSTTRDLDKMSAHNVAQGFT